MLTDQFSRSGATVVVQAQPHPVASAADSDKQSAMPKDFMKQKHTFKTSPEKMPKKQTPSTTRSCTKVHVQGVAVWRAVDLTLLGAYDELIMELEQIFDIQGELTNRKKWEIVFTDDEGDMMLVVDDPWLEFGRMVKKIFIYTCEEAKKMNSRNMLHAPAKSDELLSADSELTSEA